MQNTVAEHNALSLSGSVYFNSTTKFVKGLSPPTGPQVLGGSLSALAAGNNHQPQSSLHLSSLILKSSPPRALAPAVRTLGGQSPGGQVCQEVSVAEQAAISLSANIFMNATTKFVKGFADLTPVKQNKSRSPQKKSLSEGKQKQNSPKKTVDPEASPSAVRRQKTPEKNAMEMAGSNYMTATTKYIKPSAEDSKIDPAKNKVEKLVRSNLAGRSSNEKLEKILSRDKGRDGQSNGRSNGKVSPTKSKSSSGSKIERRKDRTRELKFVEKKQPEESLVTVKERASSIDFKTRRNDTKIIPEKPTAKPEVASTLSNTHQYNAGNEKLAESSKFQAKPLNRLQRNTINQARSADAKITQVKEESTRPFTRHPQHTRPQLIQRHANQMIKSATSLPSGELPLQTPIKLKIQSSKVISGKLEAQKQIVRAPQAAQISVIKEEKSSALQNTKTTITNKRSTNNGSAKDEASTHTQDNHTQNASTANKNGETSKIAKNQNTKIIKNEEPSVIHAQYGVGKANSPRNMKTQQKVDEIAAVQPNRQPIKRQQQAQSVKESHVSTRKTATPSILEQKKPSPISQKYTQSKMPIKTQPSDKGSKTSIEQPAIDIAKRKTVISPQSQTNTALQSRSPPTKPQEQVINKAMPEIKDIKPISPRESIKQIEVKPLLVKQASKEQITKKQSALRRSYALFQVLHKIYFNFTSKAFVMIVNQGKISKNHLKEAAILAYETVNTLRSIQRSFKASLFEKIKKIATPKLLSGKQLSLNSNKEIAANIIFRVLTSKQRDYFQSIKRNNTFNVPQNLQNKQKNSQQKLQGGNKAYSLQQLRKIIETVLKKQVQQSFNKILLISSAHQKKPTSKQSLPQQVQVRSPPKITKPVRNYLSQKQALLQTKAELQSTISSTESRMADKKRYSDLQKGKLIKKQEELMKKNKVAESQVLQKRKINKEKKSQLEALGQKQDLDISLPQYEPLIGLLTEIYSSIFATKEEKVNVEPLVKKYQLSKEDHNSLLDEWSSLVQNARLKSEIAKWQGEDPFTCSDSKLKKEGEKISQMMKSFIRERYLWEWVKATAQKV